MSIAIDQNPASASLAQSPMIFTVDANDANLLLSSSMQYAAELNFWTGSFFDSGSGSFYTLNKYPNASGVGIFDVSKIVNSSLTDKLEANTSNTSYYKVNFYSQYIPSGSTTMITGSSKIESDDFIALDGYGIFPEPINQQIENKSDFWPIMTDGPVTQSTFHSDYGSMGAWTNGITTGFATHIAYTSSLGETAEFGPLTSNADTSAMIDTFPIGEQEPGFPLVSEAEWFTIQAKNSSGYIGDKIRFEFKCEQKYPNVRIKWKNRYGQWDYFNFDMVSKEAFSATKRTYQPQLGSWDGATLSYNGYDSSIENYVSDSSQTLSVNTDWVSEDYNDIFKQLLVSDEIYVLKNDSSGDVTPITINTSNIQFKTGVVDKLIRYSFDFKLGQNYKLIL